MPYRCSDYTINILVKYIYTMGTSWTIGISYSFLTNSNSMISLWRFDVRDPGDFERRQPKLMTIYTYSILTFISKCVLNCLLYILNIGTMIHRSQDYSSV